MMPLVGSVFKYGILHWFFSALRFKYLLCLFSSEVNDFNPFCKISGQKIIFLNLNTSLKYCSFWESSCIIACELAGISYLGIVRFCQYSLNYGIHYFVTMKPKDNETGGLFVQLRFTNCAVRILYYIISYAGPHISVQSWRVSFMHLIHISKNLLWVFKLWELKWTFIKRK